MMDTLDPRRTPKRLCPNVVVSIRVVSAAWDRECAQKLEVEGKLLTSTHKQKKNVKYPNMRHTYVHQPATARRPAETKKNAYFNVLWVIGLNTSNPTDPARPRSARCPAASPRRDIFVFNLLPPFLSTVFVTTCNLGKIELKATT